MRRRCRAPGCGRFVSANAVSCDSHIDSGPVEVLAEEIDALRYVLRRVRKEIDDVEVQAKLIPRVSSVSIQAIRTRYQIGGAGTDIMTVLTPILEDLDREMNQRRTE